MRKNWLFRLHFGLIAFLFIHLIFSSTTDLSLEAGAVFSAKIIAFLTGIILFFQLWRQRNAFKYYAGIYVVFPLLVFIGFLIDRIMGAILGTFLLLFIYFPETVVQDGSYELKTEYAGLMNPCCFYGLYENKYLLFEKKTASVKLDASASDIQKLKVSPSKGNAVIYYTSETGAPAQKMVILPPR